ncbi:hypothetical protein JVT61DRAFT_1994 [Boletus reticuloceps]|uniref:Crinkler effector protein N-terminal domain-containing protein n=1 Tax=Boletus reticuloceps TaxID=495285 RepID=A0A8I3A8P5_9AGAM|nr:hypothetical protein JVT61DRAFT_1994 [Boletus reticuloceps]
MATYHLNYWIVGTSFNDVWRIKAPQDLSVDSFKKTLKINENALVDSLYMIPPSSDIISLETSNYQGQIGLLSIRKLEPIESFSVKCWLRGSDNPFDVELQNNAQLPACKIKIQYSLKSKNTAAGLSDLTLFKFSTEEDGWEKKLKNWGSGSILPSPGEVEELFNDTPFCSGYQVIIEVKSLHTTTANADITLKCWVRGDSIDRTFTIRISSTETVKNLKEIIKRRQSRKLADVDASDIDLYKATLPFSEDLSTHTLSSVGTLLQNLQKLLAIFQSNPSAEVQQLDLIVGT